MQTLEAGHRAGRLTAVIEVERKNTNRRWLFVCDCGNSKTVYLANIFNGSSSSCGCFQKENARQKRIEKSNRLTHGHAAGGKLSPTYVTWAGMQQRCTYPDNKRFAHYGGRGIKVCARWSKFENFLADMGPRPAGMTLDRINVDGNYELANCRWADAQTQQANKRKGN